MTKQERLVGNESEAENSLALYCERFFKIFKLQRSPKNLQEIYEAFSILKDQIDKGEPTASIIGKHIYEHISGEAIRKRRVTSIDFEEFLTTFFEGIIVESEDRTKYLEELPGRDDFSRRVSRNRLEKLDVRIGKLLLSVKTLIPENKELNAGSFSAEALFEGFLSPVPNERTDLGSQSALEEKFNKIAKAGNWKDFAERFEQMVRTIYLTDWIFAIKGGQHCDIYLLTGEKFRELMINCVKDGPSKAVQLINRFEAHAIRTRLEPLFAEAMHVRVDLIGPCSGRLIKLDNLIRNIQSIAVDTLCGELSPKSAMEQIQSQLKELIKIVNP